MGKGKVIPFPGLYQKFSGEENIKLLSSENLEQQWMAVQQLKRSDFSKSELNACKQFLRKEKNSPFVKSALLQILKEREIEESVLVNKFGQEMTVRPRELPDVGEDHLFSAVRHCLGRMLEPENPTFYEMALELWEHFMFAMFPFPVLPRRENVWAGAVHEVVFFMNGIAMNERNMAETYQIAESELKKAVEKIKTVEDTAFHLGG